MSLPSSITSASHYDAGTDDPKQARAQLKGLHDDVETINDHLKLSPLLSPSTPLGIGDGLESASGNLRAKLNSNPGLARAAAGLSLDINGALTAETAPAVADLVALYDATAAAHRKMTLQNLLKVINALTEDTTPDDSNDFVVTYDASAMLPKKVKLNNVGAGSWQEISGSPFSLSGTDSGTTLSSIFATGAKNYLVELGDVRGAATRTFTVTAFVGGAEETGTVYTQVGGTALSTVWTIGPVSHGINEGLSGHLLIQNPGETDTGYHTVTGVLTRRLSTTGNFETELLGWTVRSAGTFDGIKLIMNAGSFAAGREVRVYER